MRRQHSEKVSRHRHRADPAADNLIHLLRRPEACRQNDSLHLMLTQLLRDINSDRCAVKRKIINMRNIRRDIISPRLSREYRLRRSINCRRRNADPLTRKNPHSLKPLRSRRYLYRQLPAKQLTNLMRVTHNTVSRSRRSLHKKRIPAGQLSQTHKPVPQRNSLRQIPRKYPRIRRHSVKRIIIKRGADYSLIRAIKKIFHHFFLSTNCLLAGRGRPPLKRRSSPPCTLPIPPNFIRGSGGRHFLYYNIFVKGLSIIDMRKLSRVSQDFFAARQVTSVKRAENRYNA